MAGFPVRENMQGSPNIRAKKEDSAVKNAGKCGSVDTHNAKCERNVEGCATRRCRSQIYCGNRASACPRFWMSSAGSSFCWHEILLSQLHERMNQPLTVDAFVCRSRLRDISPNSCSCSMELARVYNNILVRPACKASTVHWSHEYVCYVCDDSTKGTGRNTMRQIVADSRVILLQASVYPAR
jgi:hypothetical protein